MKRNGVERGGTQNINGKGKERAISQSTEHEERMETDRAIYFGSKDLTTAQNGGVYDWSQKFVGKPYRWYF